MLSVIRPAIVTFLALTVLTGAIYPAIVTGIAKVAFSGPAGGSLVVVDGKAVGSSLIAQPFTDPKYFWPRPSAANYDGSAASGSNLAPGNPALAEIVESRIKALRAADPGNTAKVPIDLVTASGSGLDPHISYDAAIFQLSRVASARHLTKEAVRQLVNDHAEGPVWQVFGERHVNVLLLNLALDGHDSTAHSTATSDAGISRWPMSTR